MSALLSLDTALLWSIQEVFSCALLDWAMPLITHLGDGGVLWVAMGLLLLLFQRTRRAGLAVLLSMALCLVVGNGMIKPLVARARPYVADPSILLLVAPPIDPFSFPSGHTMHSLAASCALGLAGARRLFYPALTIAVLIAFSRIYLMVHYPLDVACGGLLGFLAACLINRLLPLIIRFIQRYTKTAF